VSGKEGSAVIEAVASLTIFIVAIMTVLSFINLCRAQALVSNAVDAAAKEMSQYAYFYHLTGLNELSQKAADGTAADRKKLDNIAGGLEAVYSVLGTIHSPEVSSGDIQGLVNGAVDYAQSGKPDGSDAGKIGQMVKTLGSIDNPMGFIKSVGVIAVQEAGSRLIAAPLAKVLVKKHFEVDGMDADTYLRTLNIDGMDALNFGMSTFCAPTEPNDIHLVCYYQMTPVKFFNFDFGTIVLCKESSTRAWMGGDREYKAGEKKESAVWDMGQLKYGSYIVKTEKEKLLKQECYEAAVPGVDVFDADNNLCVNIRSMDIFCDSYKDETAGKEKIMAELRKEYNKLASAADISGDSFQVKDKNEKKTVPSARDSRGLKLILVIPEGKETDMFREAYQAFCEEMREQDPGFQVEKRSGYGKSPNDPANQKKETKGADHTGQKGDGT